MNVKCTCVCGSAKSAHVKPLVTYIDRTSSSVRNKSWEILVLGVRHRRGERARIDVCMGITCPYFGIEMSRVCCGKCERGNVSNDGQRELLCPIVTCKNFEHFYLLRSCTKYNFCLRHITSGNIFSDISNKISCIEIKPSAGKSKQYFFSKYKSCWT